MILAGLLAADFQLSDMNFTLSVFILCKLLIVQAVSISKVDGTFAGSQICVTCEKVLSCWKKKIKSSVTTVNGSHLGSVY